MHIHLPVILPGLSVYYYQFLNTNSGFKEDKQEKMILRGININGPG